MASVACFAFLKLNIRSLSISLQSQGVFKIAAFQVKQVKIITIFRDSLSHVVHIAIKTQILGR